MKITWYGTAALRLENREGSILFDPYIPMEGSPVHTTAEDYDNNKNILITHAHLDHVASLPVLWDRQQREIYGSHAVQEAMDRMGRKDIPIHRIEPGSRFELDGFRITAYHGCHVHFDRTLIRHTLLNHRILEYNSNLPQLMDGMVRCREKKEILGYLVESEGKRIFVLGSMGVDPEVVYPEKMDLLVMPFQGNSNLLSIADGLLRVLKPKAVFLDHFDDTYPPISNTIDTSEIEECCRGFLPVTVPVQGIEYNVL